MRASESYTSPPVDKASDGEICHNMVVGRLFTVVLGITCFMGLPMAELSLPVYRPPKIQGLRRTFRDYQGILKLIS